MSMSSHLLERAIKLWKSGQKKQAHKIFETIVFNDRHNEAAWVWYIYTLETNPEKIAALENFLTIFPQHTTGKKALVSLKEQEKPSVLSKLPRETIQKKTESIPQIKLVASPKLQSVQKPRSLFLPWLLVLFGLCLLLFSSAAFLTSYSSLQARYKSMAANRDLISRNFAQLSQDYETLKSEHSRLVEQSNSLTSQYNNLNYEYSNLNQQYNTLSAEHANLQETYHSLLVEYNNTAQSYTELKDKAIVPPYIYISGREVYLAFLTPDQSIYKWSVPFDMLEYDLGRGNIERNKAAMDFDYPRLSLTNTNNGDNYRIIDYRKFVDPSEFTTFSRYFYDRAPSEEAFIYELWYIVAQLTSYSSEIQDTPRYPLETLLAGGGDCEDHAILFASMILAAAPSNWNVDLVYMDSDHPTAPQTVNHLIVYIDTGNRQYIVESTGKQVMEPYPQVDGWYFKIDS